MTALGEGDEFCSDFARSSRNVDEKQSSNSILTEWIGMGRSGPQITAKLQLWDCVTLTMVVISLLYPPGKWMRARRPAKSVLLRSEPGVPSDGAPQSSIGPGGGTKSLECLLALLCSPETCSCFPDVQLFLWSWRYTVVVEKKSFWAHRGDKVPLPLTLLAQQREWTQLLDNTWSEILENKEHHILTTYRALVKINFAV